MIVIEIVILAIEILLAVQIGYLLLLTLAAVLANRRPPTVLEPKTRFAVLIPAHNEERLLPELLTSLNGQNYPRALFTCYVVADNCTDGTAAAAARLGAVVFERTNQVQVGKGYALNWLFEQIEAALQPLQADESSGSPLDAVVILDSDTIVSPQFLQIMDAHLQHGDRAVQGYYAVRDPGKSWGVALRYAALAVLHYLRPLGRGLFGGSAGLKGNGMCFAYSLYKQHPWSGSVTEDIEYHMTLLLAGERVAFAPQAFLEAEMPGTLKSSTTQNVRWESGRLQAARMYILRLAQKMISSRSFLFFDAIMEHIIPPTAMVILALAGCLALAVLPGWLAGNWVLFQAGLTLLAGLGIYILAGLWMVKAPPKVWLSLLYAPFYAFWKIILLGRILLGKQKQGWVRTER